ncbi:long-chain fatty acid--CoA ligase [Fulvimarina sp. 2208YS6-2-32]|uniref:Long-chain fatty acid--CoA ligase n=1 Tax=Fulvimarina uroteuthidis TaxID=3098149 RepID=A0ABU5I3P0_9HYPH|nr:long-chain fatty acid--CoA ligase [Fulvimarina sp. 2208YS6-2-32]
MQALMMDVPLLVSGILDHAAKYHTDTEVVSAGVGGRITRKTYGEVAARSAQLAHALDAMGIGAGDRVATMAWNSNRHLELYFAVGGSGRVCHTINPRLFPEQIAFILDHADDKAVFVEPMFLPLLETLKDALPKGLAIVVLCEEDELPASGVFPDLVSYEGLIAGRSGTYEWPRLDENEACSLCYTSGTTGNPKGVLYSHRSSVLHAMAIGWVDAIGLSGEDTACLVVPMFHVNAWGLPYACPMMGAKMVMPGANLDGASLRKLFDAEGVTMSAGVPTIWMGLTAHMEDAGATFGTLKRVAVGGSAMPAPLIERMNALGVSVRHAWGMTETSPVGLASALKPKHANLSDEERLTLNAKQGRPLFGMQFRVEGADGSDVPRDAKSYGALLVRGPWVASRYFGSDSESPSFRADGWFETGDVVTIDPDGYVQIVDRTKDVIKSGGEWISSIELENVATGHPAVKEAAVVARTDDKWGERPVLFLVVKDGRQAPTADDIRSFYEGKVARWCIPDDVRIVDALPHTATGKLRKTDIRDML